MSKKQKLHIAYKCFFGLLGLSALVTEIVVLLGRGSFAAGNFFSFFTVQSNILAALLLLASAALLATGQRRLHDSIRGAAVLYMVVTGIIFAMMLSGLDPRVLTAVPWDNTVLHYIMPLAVFVDWILDPPRQRIMLRQALAWLAFPLAYLLYTLVRGHFAAWYPYPFVNVEQQGYIRVLVVSLAIALVITLLAWFVAHTTRWTTKTRRP